MTRSWLFRLLLVPVFLVFLSSQTSYSQSPDDQITVHTLNKKYLEHLIKIGVDSVRRSHGLTNLINDSILYVAAQGHADYLYETKNFSHYEKEYPIMETPQLRAEFHGAVNYSVGENIIKSFLNKKLKDKKGKTYMNKTYRQLANDFVTGWVNSPPHFKNIKTPEWQVTGLAISINKDKKLIYGVQKFGKIHLKYQFEENKEMFAWSGYEPPPLPTSFDGIPRTRKKKVYEWGIKAPKDSVNFCESCNAAIDSSLNPGRFEFKGRNVYYTTPDVDMMFQLIRRAKDGFALEFVDYEPFDCGNPQYYYKPSRRNGQSLLNGYVTKPVYKKDLKKGFKKAKYKWYFRNRRKGDARLFYYKVGRQPKNMLGYTEMNLVVLQKNRVCRIMHFTGRCGETYLDSVDVEIPVPLDSFEYDPGELTAHKKVKFTVPFEKGKSEYDFNDIAPHLGFLADTKFIVDSARIKAYASLEGTKEINLRLMRERAEAILEVFAEGEHNFPKKISTSENWELWEQQIENDDKLAQFKDMSQAEVKRKLMDEALQAELEPILSEQRKGEVTLHLHYIVPISELADTLVPLFESYFERDAQGQWQTNEPAENLLKIQYKLYELYKQGHCDYSKVDALNYLYPYSKGLQEQKVWMDYKEGMYDHSNGMSAMRVDLEMPPNMMCHPFEVTYIHTQLLINHMLRGGEVEIDDLALSSQLESLISGATGAQRTKLIGLRPHLYMQFMNYFRVDGDHRDDDKLRQYAEILFLASVTDSISVEELYRRASLLSLHEQTDLAYQLVDLYIGAGIYDDRIQTMHAKLGYYHIEERNDPAYFEDLIKKYDKMEALNWCSMFVGECNISFQVFDYERLRTFYCEKCGDYENEAEVFLTTPEDERK